MSQSLAAKAINHIFGAKNPVYLGNNLAIVKTLYRIKLTVDTRDMSIAPHILIDRQWEPSITKFFHRRIKKGYRIIEIGSNIGYFTTISAKKVGSSGKIFAFEANPDVYKICKNNIELNGFDKIVDLKNLAISDKQGTISLQKFNLHQGNSTIVKKELLSGYGEEIESIIVPTETIDNLLSDEHIDFIKIDAEGSERLIFSGMENLIKKNPNIKILCEFFPERLMQAGTSPHEFLDYLSKLGFTISTVDDNANIQKCTKKELIDKSFSELFLSK